MKDEIIIRLNDVIDDLIQRNKVLQHAVNSFTIERNKEENVSGVKANAISNDISNQDLKRAVQAQLDILDSCIAEVKSMSVK